MRLKKTYGEHCPESQAQLFAFEKTVATNSLGPTINDLVRMRVSQINGCLFCLDMHAKEAKLHGERELRIYHLSVWRESTLFNGRERSALAWAEALTRLGRDDFDGEFQAVSRQFSEQEVVELTFVVGVMNVWNRFGVAFQTQPGSLDKMMGLDKAGLA
ncbi:MAG: carboxymuconolactone decarboxylase family protein [bacterium]